MAEGIFYPKGVVPRNEDFREAQKMRGEVYNFLKTTMEETAESAFQKLGYNQKAAPAGFYGDGNAYGFGVGEGVYNVKVGSKTDSYLEKRISLGGKRIVVEMHMTIFPESMTVEMHYKNTEDAAFRGFKEGKGGYMINEKLIENCADMDKFKKTMTKKLEEFAEKEIGYITMTKLGNDDRMEKSTASVVEGLSLVSLFEDDFDTTSNKIMEAVTASKQHIHFRTVIKDISGNKYPVSINRAYNDNGVIIVDIDYEGDEDPRPIQIQYLPRYNSLIAIMLDRFEGQRYRVDIIADEAFQQELESWAEELVGHQPFDTTSNKITEATALKELSPDTYNSIARAGEKRGDDRGQAIASQAMDLKARPYLGMQLNLAIDIGDGPKLYPLTIKTIEATDKSININARESDYGLFVLSRVDSVSMLNSTGHYKISVSDRKTANNIAKIFNALTSSQITPQSLPQSNVTTSEEKDKETDDLLLGDKMSESYEYLYHDDWSNPVFKDTENDRLLVGVDGMLHTMTDEGEPIYSLDIPTPEVPQNEIIAGDKVDENDQENEEEFIPHGVFTTSNHGGYEIQISDDGDGARLRYHGGQPSDWIEIQHDDEGAYVIDPDNDEKLELSNFMKIRNEITTAGAGAGGAGGFGYDAPFGAPRKRTTKTSAPFDQAVNEGQIDEIEGFGTSSYLDAGNDFMDALVDDAGLDYMKSENPDILAFDFMDAITVFRHDYNEDHPFLHYLGSLQQKNDYSPAMGLSYESLSDEAKMLYDELERGEDFYKEREWEGMTYENNQMNEAQRKFESTPYAKRLRENHRPTNHTRIIPEGTDGFWTVVPQETLDAYKKNHIIGAPGAEGVEVNSKEEEEYNSGGYQKFAGGKSYGLKEDVNRDRQKYHAWSYLQKATSPVVISEIADSKTLIIFEEANPNNAEVEANGYQVMEVPQVLELMENGGYHAMLVANHKIHQEAVNESVKKRFKYVHVQTQTELNERWKRLSTMKDAETIHEAESVVPDREEIFAPKRRISESVEGLNSLSRDGGIEEGETIDGKLVVEIEKPRCLAPVFYKVFKEDYENEKRAFIWDFNTGMLVNNPGFKVQ